MRSVKFGLFLEGWENQSIWGWDAGLGTFYAQLTRNSSSDANGPDVWITPPQYPQIASIDHLARTIASGTGADLAAVHDAMNVGIDYGGPDAAEPLISRLPTLS